MLVAITQIPSSANPIPEKAPPKRNGPLSANTPSPLTSCNRPSTNALVPIQRGSARAQHHHCDGREEDPHRVAAERCRHTGNVPDGLGDPGVALAGDLVGESRVQRAFDERSEERRVGKECRL